MLYCRILATIGSLLPISTEAISQPWDVFDQAKRLVEAESFGRDGRGWLARLGTSLAVADGNLVAGLHWTEELVDPFWSDRQGSHPPRHRRSRGGRRAGHRLCAVSGIGSFSNFSSRPMRHRSGGGRETRGHSGRNGRREQPAPDHRLRRHRDGGARGTDAPASPGRVVGKASATGRCTDLVASGSKPAGRAADRTGTGRPAFFAQPG